MCTALFTQNLKDMRGGTRCVIQAQINCSAHKAISTFLQNASHLKYNHSADIRSIRSSTAICMPQLLERRLSTLNFWPSLEHQRNYLRTECLYAIGAGWTKSGCKDNVLNKHTQHCYILMDIFTNIPPKYPTGYKKGRFKTAFSISCSVYGYCTGT